MSGNLQAIGQLDCLIEIMQTLHRIEKKLGDGSVITKSDNVPISKPKKKNRIGETRYDVIRED